METKILPPHYLENVRVKEDLVHFVAVTECTKFSLEEVKNDDEKRADFLSSHPSPCYQGPFLKPIGLQWLGDSFKTFTTFTHDRSIKCGVWTPKEQNGIDIFYTKQEIPYDLFEVLGPCSNGDGRIIYSCCFGKCQIGCVCYLCTAPRSTCRKRLCLESPCTKCELQCKKHSICITRMFKDTEDSFTIVSRIAPFVTEHKKEFSAKSDRIFLKYAGIPKNCEVCTTDLRDHELYHKTLHFRCKFCRFQFRSIKNAINERDVMLNTRKLHSRDEETCSLCLKVFTKKTARIMHEKYAHALEKFQCSVCSRFLQTKQGLEKHIENFHTPTLSIFECDKCNKIVSTKEILSRHKKTVHGSAKTSCEFCGLKFSRYNHFMRHLTEVHGRETRKNLDFVSAELMTSKPFKCDICGKGFARYENLRRHNAHVHEKSVGLTCTCKYCGQNFLRQDNLKRHEKTCRDSPKNKAKSIVDNLIEDAFNSM